MGDSASLPSPLAAPCPAPIPDRLAGHVTIITGAAGYIGLGAVRRFLLEGAKVVLVDIDDARLASAKDSLLREIPQAGRSILVIRGNAASEMEVQAFVEQTVAHFGRLDSAFLCAGVSYSSTPLLDTSVELYDRIMEANCRSAFIGVKHCGQAMKKLGTHGSLILMSSASGLRATKGLSAYSMSKFALRGLSLTAAAELGPYGIRVNTVHPSGVATPMFTRSWPDDVRSHMLTTVPLGRWALPDDIAAVVTFLASSDAQYLTGGTFKVDGGSVSS